MAPTLLAVTGRRKRPEGELVPTREAAKALGISHRTLNHYVQTGILRPTLRLPGGQLRWDLDDLWDQLQALDERRREEGDEGG